MLKWNQGMKMYMVSVQITCEYKRCYWKGCLEQYESHLKECVAKEVDDSNDGAKKLKMKNNLDEMRKKNNELREQVVSEKLNVKKEQDINNYLKDMFESAMVTLHEDAVRDSLQKKGLLRLRQLNASKISQLKELRSTIRTQNTELERRNRSRSPGRRVICL